LIGNRADDLWDEQVELDVDKKAFMKGRVVKTRAGWNLCFADYDQEPDYENKRALEQELTLTSRNKAGFRGCFTHREAQEEVCEGDRRQGEEFDG
jgi:hypothetical protein